MSLTTLRHWKLLPICACSAVLLWAVALFAQPEGKAPPPEPEPNAIDVRVPSETAGTEGLVVRVTPSDKPRYGSEAPVAVSVPGGGGAVGIDGLRPKMTEGGFIWVRFNFQGGGEGKLKSGGMYDDRGPVSMKALRDVIRFAQGKIKTTDGRSMTDLVSPIVPLADNVGLLGLSNGGNATVNVAGAYGEAIAPLAWIVNWESPLGDGILNRDAGTKQKQNPAYDPDKGEYDYSLLAYDASIPIGAKRTGGLFWDINRNGKYDQDQDYATQPFPRQPEEGSKVFYAEGVTRYALDHHLFPESSAVPPATLEETIALFKGREGHHWYADAVRKHPGLLFIVIGNDTDHVQVAIDHPHVLNQYEGMIKAGARFVRLNPDKAYIEAVAGHPVPTAVDNDAFMPLDHISIRKALQPLEGFDIERMQPILSAAEELADRTKTGNVAPNLDKVLIALK